MARTPHPAQTRRLAATDPVPLRTPFGEIKIPEPGTRMKTITEQFTQLELHEYKFIYLLQNISFVRRSWWDEIGQCMIITSLLKDLLTYTK